MTLSYLQDNMTYRLMNKVGFLARCCINMSGTHSFIPSLQEHAAVFFFNRVTLMYHEHNTKRWSKRAKRHEDQQFSPLQSAHST